MPASHIRLRSSGQEEVIKLYYDYARGGQRRVAS